MTDVYYNASNFIVSNGFIKNPKRYYLEEFFPQLPQVNSAAVPNLSGNDVTDQNNIAILNTVNKNFEIIGTNVSNDDVTFSLTDAGIILETDGADNDNIIVQPHLYSGLTAWNNIKWNTGKHLEWECSIKTGASIADMSFWAGLKKTNVPEISTNSDQAYFIYSSNDDMGTLTTNTNLHFVYTIGGTHQVTNLGLLVSVNTNYRLKIVIDSNRQVCVYVNEVQYGLTQTTSSVGVLEDITTQKSLALTVENLIPYIGVQGLTTSAKSITLNYEKISREL